MNNRIVVSEPCSIEFILNSKPLFIYMSSGLEYHRRNEGGNVTVNFPLCGTYTANYKEISREPLKCDCKPVVIDGKRIIEKQINNIARRNMSSGIIEVSPKLKKANYQFQQFILEHELAHAKTLDEKTADSIAVDCYLKNGFNRTQILHCLKQFAPQQYERFYKLLIDLKNK